MMAILETTKFLLLISFIETSFSFQPCIINNHVSLKQQQHQLAEPRTKSCRNPTSSTTSSYYLSSTTKIYGKTPSSNFDLDSILDFEKELEKQKQIEIQKMNSNDLMMGDDNDDDKGEEEDHDFLMENEDVQTYQVPPELHEKRIDAILFELDDSISRSQYGTLISDGMVAISVPKTNDNMEENKGDSNDQEYEKPSVCNRKAMKLEQGTIIHVKNVIEEKPTEIIAQDLPLDIVYEDEYMIVLNKAAGMVVHPAVGNWDGTVVNALAYYLANKSPFGKGDFIQNDDDGNVSVDAKNIQEGIEIDGTDGEAIFFRPGIVHRLDKGTTGLLVVAKTREALANLSEAFAAREVKKTYVAVTIGNPGKQVVINKPIGRHPIHRQRMRVVPDPTKMNSSGMTQRQRIKLGLANGKSAAQIGRHALSYVDTLAFDGKLSVAQIRIETGRTHQIRVHLQDRTTPIYGDDLYGFTDWNKRLAKSHRIERPLLHAFRLELVHPITGEKMVFRAPMAQDMITIAEGIWPTGTEERRDLFEKTEAEF